MRAEAHSTAERLPRHGAGCVVSTREAADVGYWAQYRRNPAFVRMSVIGGRPDMRCSRLYSGPVKFVLSGSGDMAGVISPPGGKYGHWANDNLPPSPDEWFGGAMPPQGSWWPVWDQWVAQLDSARIPARPHPAAAGYRLSKTRRALTSASDRWPHKFRERSGSILRPARKSDAMACRQHASNRGCYFGVCVDHRFTLRQLDRLQMPAPGRPP
jgi:hypothetical protein